TNEPGSGAGVAGAGPGPDAHAELADAAGAADPTMPPPGVRPMREAMGTTLARRELNTLLIAAFAAGALVLALVGIYGVMSYSVSQERREIAIRVAIGASPGAVTRQVVGRALVLAAGGVALGAARALALS